MKKLLTMLLALSLTLLIMFAVACSKGNNPTGNSATITPAPGTTTAPTMLTVSPSPTENLDNVDVDDIEDLTTVVDITAKIKTSGGSFLSAGTVIFTLEDGSSLNAEIGANNELEASSTPKNVLVNMQVKDASGKELAVSSFKLWDGYDLNAYENEEGNIDIDVPSDAETLYMVFTISGNIVECTHISETGF